MSDTTPDERPDTPPPAPSDSAPEPAPDPKQPEEIGGPKGPEPTRFGDWERGGRCSDF